MWISCPGRKEIYLTILNIHNMFVFIPTWARLRQNSWLYLCVASRVRPTIILWYHCCLPAPARTEMELWRLAPNQQELKRSILFCRHRPNLNQSNPTDCATGRYIILRLKRFGSYSPTSTPQCKACIVQCAVRSVDCLVWIVQYSVAGVHCASCSVQRTFRSLHCAVYSVYGALCSVCSAFRSVHCAACLVQCVLCIIPRAFYSVHRAVLIPQRALYSVHCAVCSVKGDVFSLYFVRIVQFSMQNWRRMLLVCNVQWVVWNV